jgi:methyltransferase FkbM-like protein
VAAPVSNGQEEIGTGRQKKGVFHVNLVKLDVEEGEELVLCGAASTLARLHALVIFEVNCDASQRLAASANQAWKLLREAGFSSWTLRESMDSSELQRRVPHASENVTATYAVHG